MIISRIQTSNYDRQWKTKVEEFYSELLPKKLDTNSSVRMQCNTMKKSQHHHLR